MDVVGMTLAPEAKLARDAELCLCGILTVTDYDCWYEGEKDVSVASIVENLKKNDNNMANIIRKLVPKIKYKRTCECYSALEHGLLTSPELLIKQGNPQVNKVLLKRFMR
jgi:5'-methylthioadenosine phosphorylase